MTLRKMTSNSSKRTNRRKFARALRLEHLDQRQLLAANVVDDSFFITQESALNVLTNDSSGAEVQNVSAFNADYDRSTYETLRGGNDTDWFIPQRVDPNDANNTIPQRSIITGAVMFQDDRADGFNGGGNNGDVDLLRDNDDDPANDADLTEDQRLVLGEGMLLATLRENFSPASGDPFGNENVNVGVVQFRTEGAAGDTTWVPIAAGPENNGERSSYFGAAFFEYSNGWVGSSFNPDASLNHGSSDIVATGSGGRYEATVNGVTDSFNEGWLFAIGGDNEDNYTRTQPIEGGAWRVQHRDNAAEIDGAESDHFNLMYIPRSAQGLTGGVVTGDSTAANPMKQSFGDFSIQREEDGLWRLNIPGHSPESGVLVMETVDTTVDQPRNSYFSYVQDEGTDDFLIRQFAWDSNSENRLNTDFVFFFIPFENTLNPASTLNVVPGSLGTVGSPGSGVSEQGVALGINADGTVDYAAGDAVAALAEGQTATDTFIYDATDGTETNTATVTVNWVGVNDAPTISNQLPPQTFNEDDAAVDFDLATLFSDVDNGDSLSYEVDPGVGGLLVGSVNGSILSLAPAPDRFGYTVFSITATDTAGASVTMQVSATIFSQDDAPRAVDDSTATTRLDTIDIDAIANDFHPETTEFSVAAGIVGADSAATDNAGSQWTVSATSAAPNELTIQSAANLGDVAVGRNGLDLSLGEGVLLGTAREATAPYATVNTYAAFGSYGFATDTGEGQAAGTGAGPERNALVNAGFFPYGEGWTSGQVDADGTLLGGVGISPADIAKLQDGEFTITIPGVANASTDGILLVSAVSNDDNVISAVPSTKDGTWTVRQVDSDGGQLEDDAWSFVFIPSDTSDLIGGSWTSLEEDEGELTESYGGVTAELSGESVIVSIPGFTPADGAMLAVSTLTNAAILATPNGSDFQLDSFAPNTPNWTRAATSFEFVFLPFDEPLERIAGLELSISEVDATSALGAAVTLNPDGTINYDPTDAGGDIAALQPGETLDDTFTYTLTDARNPAQTSTGTVTITVSGPNQAPTAFDDTINLNENSSQNATLTVLGNDVDPDFDAIFGTPAGVISANLSVDGSSNWTVSQTGAAPNNITIGSSGLGDVEILKDGNPIAPTDGLVLATIRENADSDTANFRLVQAYENGTGGTSLSLQSFGVDGLADADVAVSYFPFGDNWVGGHVDSLGSLTAGSGLAAGDVVRTETGRYSVSIPGVTDAARDGFLFVIGNEAADNVVSTRAIPTSSTYEIAVRDNGQNFGDGEDGGFSFIFIPRNAENLVAGAVNPFSPFPNTVDLGVGEYNIERQAVAGGGNEWRLTIPGMTPADGVLLLTNQDNGEIEDNYLTYEDSGDGSFLIRNHDMPQMSRQDQPFTFMFIPFADPGLPVARPVPGPLSITTADGTSAQGATVTINPDGTLNYDPGSIYDALDTGDSAVDTFSYTMTDGFGGESSATVTVNINGVGATPVLEASPGLSKFSIGSGTGVQVDSNFFLEDSQPFVPGSFLTVENAGGEATDLLEIGNIGDVTVSGSDVSFVGTVIGTFTGGDGTNPLVVTFNGSADTNSMEAVARAVLFSNSDAAIPVSTRNISFSFTDGNGTLGQETSKPVALRNLLIFQEGVDFGFGAYTGTQDKELLENDPGGTAPQSDPILIDYNEGGAESQALLRFDNIFGETLGQIPAGATIVSANLILETSAAKDANAEGDGARFYRMLEDWDQATTTWASLGLTTNDDNGQTDEERDPTRGINTDDVQARASFESAIGTEGGGGDTNTGFLTMSVLPDVQAWSAGEGNFGWAFKGWVNNTNGWFFSPSEDAESFARPKLEVEWLPAETVSASFQEGVDGYASTVDTDISEGSSDDNSEDATVFVDAPTRSVLLRFEDIIGGNTGQIPAGSEILSATLRTASTSNNSQGDGGRFYTMLTDWAETATWDDLDNGISTDGVEASATFNTSAGSPALTPEVMAGWQDWDVSLDIQDWVNGKSNFGWAMLPWAGGTDGWGFQTSEADVVSDRPKLEVFFRPADFNPTVEGSFLFYNDSSFDGDTGATPNDDAAVAIDKSPYIAGSGQATFANYSSYSAGLNGVAVDIAGAPGTITADDFTFKVGNDQNPANWADAPAPAEVAVRAGDGVNGASRVSIIWADNAIQNQWLELTVLANADTGLDSDVTFYWGNQIGETGNVAGETVVDDADATLVRENTSGFSSVAIASAFDINRDQRVNVVDHALVQTNATAGNSIVLLDLGNGGNNSNGDDSSGDSKGSDDSGKGSISDGDGDSFVRFDERTTDAALSQLMSSAEDPFDMLMAERNVYVAKQATSAASAKGGSDDKASSGGFTRSNFATVDRIVAADPSYFVPINSGFDAGTELNAISIALGLGDGGSSQGGTETAQIVSGTLDQTAWDEDSAVGSESTPAVLEVSNTPALPETASVFDVFGAGATTSATVDPGVPLLFAEVDLSSKTAGDTVTVNSNFGGFSAAVGPNAVELDVTGTASSTLQITVLGDANGDGLLTNVDIGPFLLALTNRSEYVSQFPLVDVNSVLDFTGDNLFTNVDIGGFLAALTGN